MTGQLFASPVTPRDTDERYTPKWIFDGLGVRFALDVAAPSEGPLHVPCDHWFTATDDGLAQDWAGLVWCNPPYSQSTPWARRFIDHGNGVWLGPLANSAWFQELLDACDLAWFCADFAFIGSDHTQRHAGMPLAMFAIGSVASAGLARLGLSGRHRGQLMRRSWEHGAAPPAGHACIVHTTPSGKRRWELFEPGHPSHPGPKETP